MTELLLLANFLALFTKGARKRALLVWTCYDREKLIAIFVVSSVVFCGYWYILFFDWNALAGLNSLSRRGGRLVLFLAVSMPLVTIVFGHMATIIALGTHRVASRRLRRLRSNSANTPII
jgi:hypothetical protein